MATLERAIALAAKAHEGQVDKAGAPYILHPLRVMMRLKTPEERMAGVLHDTVEDTDITFEKLRAEGFSEAVIKGIDAVTKREGEDYETFVKRSAADPVGRMVKLADLADNSDLTRLAAPTAKDLARVEKYKKAIAQLKALGAG